MAGTSVATPVPRTLLVLLLVYGACTLVHFVHNAELVAEYPNMPGWISRGGVYVAWLGMTAVGLAGFALASRGFRVAGLLLFVVYAALGLDSLGHYLLAPMGRHTLVMNATILLEVTTAGVVLWEVLRLLAQGMPRRAR